MNYNGNQSQKDYVFIDSKAILMLKIYPLIFYFMGGATIYSLIKGTIKNYSFSSLFITTVVTIILIRLLYLMKNWAKKAIKTQEFGVSVVEKTISFQKSCLKFDGMSVGKEGFIKSRIRWWKEGLDIMTLPLSEIQSINYDIKHKDVSNGKVIYSYWVVLHGAFGIAEINMPNEQRMEQLYTAIVTTNDMGQPNIIK